MTAGEIFRICIVPILTLILLLLQSEELKKLSSKSLKILFVALAIMGFAVYDGLDKDDKERIQQKEFAAQFQQTRREIIDSMRNIYQSPAPVLALGTGDKRPGIRILEKLPNDYYKIEITLMSREAASAYFNIKNDFLVQDTSGVYRIMPTPNAILEHETVLSKDESVTATRFVWASSIQTLYLWLRGSYKRRDGTGDFKIDDLYGLTPKSDSILLYQGGTRKGIINLITNLSK